VFDIDVLGADNLQKQYPESSLSIFVKPPSVEVLFERLERRQTESAESLAVRKSRSAKELEMESKFDKVVVNDDLETAIREVNSLVSNFIKPN
jgi:guanylate kinase